MSWWRKQLGGEDPVRVHYVNWNIAFEASPLGGDNPVQGDDKIREFKLAVRERFTREHFMNTASGLPTEDGEHRAGSARAYHQSAAPTLQPDAATALSADDVGRLWVDTDTGGAFYWNGTAWVSLSRVYLRWSVEGTVALATNIKPQIVWPRSGRIVKVTGRLDSAPTGSSFILDINKNGSTSIFAAPANRVTIAAGTNVNSSTSFDAVQGVFAAEDYISFDIDQVGSGTPGANLTVAIEYLQD